jgi:hypothetical protein
LRIFDWWFMLAGALIPIPFLLAMLDQPPMGGLVWCTFCAIMAIRQEITERKKKARDGTFQA